MPRRLRHALVVNRFDMAICHIGTIAQTMRATNQMPSQYMRTPCTLRNNHLVMPASTHTDTTNTKV